MPSSRLILCRPLLFLPQSLPAMLLKYIKNKCLISPQWYIINGGDTKLGLTSVHLVVVELAVIGIHFMVDVVSSFIRPELCLVCSGWSSQGAAAVGFALPLTTNCGALRIRRRYFKFLPLAVAFPTSTTVFLLWDQGQLCIFTPLPLPHGLVITSLSIGLLHEIMNFLRM